VKVLVSGGSGFLGSALERSLVERGDAIVRLSRGAPNRASDVRWDPAARVLDPRPLAGLDAVVHLAGASIGARRWSPAWKATILESRREGTRFLSETLAALDPPPRTLVSASAIGYYGDRGDEALTEASPPGRGFLADVARAWESATAPAERAGMRVVHLRIGLVLDCGGGALERLLTPFRLGVGGPLGNGRQWWSWIALEDLTAAMLHALDRADLSGPINAVAPAPVTNREFARALGRALRRPALLPAPAFALRLLLGRERADELLLASQRVTPRVLLDGGFGFRRPVLEEALDHALHARAPAGPGGA
jgi:uncharacterized protein (TIGR01777 family)